MKTKTIYKYPLELGINELEIPYEKILNVIIQGRIPTLYVLIDDEQQNKKVQVQVIGTGWDIGEGMIDNSIYLNTVTDGIYVWHVFYNE